MIRAPFANAVSPRRCALAALVVLLALAPASGGRAENHGPADEPTSAPATTPEEPEAEPDALGDDVAPGPHRDPLEEVNRVFFTVNRGVEWLILDPLSRLYGFVVPETGKRALRGILSNLNSPVVLVNDLLQLEACDAGSTTARFLINSTVGLLGVWDPAARLGIEKHHSDFGETLARAGVPNGPYLVLPVLGPTTARDALGDAIDLLFRPQTYLLGPGELLVLGTGEGITIREEHLEALEELRKSSLDYYATVRSAYFLFQEEELRQHGLLKPRDPLLDESF